MWYSFNSSVYACVFFCLPLPSICMSVYFCTISFKRQLVCLCAASVVKSVSILRLLKRRRTSTKRRRRRRRRRRKRTRSSDERGAVAFLRLIFIVVVVRHHRIEAISHSQETQEKTGKCHGYRHKCR